MVLDRKGKGDFMIDGNLFFVSVKKYFNFLVIEQGFSLLEENTRGNIYFEVQFKKETTIISISYENHEDYLSIVIYKLQSGRIPSFNDKANIIELKSLTAKIIPDLDKIEINNNNEFFSEFHVDSLIEKKIMKSARNLRLCFPYINTK